ncbi:MAG: polysaccharide deacetylase family protein [Ktedonobacteraceae bacterium]
MRKRTGIFVAACLYYSGLVALSRWLMERAGRRLIILNYHRARGGDIRRHLVYLRRHYRILHLEEALQELYTPSNKDIQGSDKRTPLVLTFDDGYHDNYTHLFPYACQLQVPVTLFLIPGYLESGEYFWWSEGHRLVHRAEVEAVTVDGRVYQLGLADERAALSQMIDARLRYVGSVAEREKSLVLFRQMLAVPSNVTVEEEGDRPLTWAEVHKMAESRWVSYGAHTMHHPVLAYLMDPDEVAAEVETCRTLLEERLGHPVCTFAYPVGRTEHIGDEAVRAVKAAGYKWAVTTHSGVNTPEDDPLRLRRVLGDVSRHWLVMAAETSGIWHIFSPLWKATIGKGESA